MHHVPVVLLVVMMGCACSERRAVSRKMAPDFFADSRQTDGPLPDGPVYHPDLSRIDVAKADMVVTYPHTVYTMPLTGFHALRVDAAKGSLRILGRFSGILTVGTSTLTALGSTDLCVVEMTSAGTPSWAARAGGNLSEWGHDIVVDDKGIAYLTGGFEGTATIGSLKVTSLGDADIFAARLSPGGKVQWASAGGSSGGASAERGMAMAVDPAGNSYVVGAFQGVASFGSATLASNGGRDLFLVKLDPAGKVVWALSAGGPKNDLSQGVAVDGAGNVLIAGNYTGGISLGTHALKAALSDAMFMAKLTPAGKVLWAASSVNLDGLGVAIGLGVDSNSNAYLGGHFMGTISFGGHKVVSHKSTQASNSQDVFVARFSPSGAVQWVVSGGGTGDDYLRDLAVDAAGYTLLTGKHRAGAQFGKLNLTVSGPAYSDLYVARVDPWGQFVHAESGGAPSGVDEGVAAAIDGQTAYVVGSYSPGAVIGGSALPSSPSSGGSFLWKIALAP